MKYADGSDAIRFFYFLEVLFTLRAQEVIYETGVFLRNNKEDLCFPNIVGTLK